MLRLSGGGKRASSGAVKVGKQDKLNQLKDEIDTSLPIIRSQTLPTIANGLTELLNAKTMMEKSPEDAINTAFQGLDVPTLKKLQAACMTGNLEHKLSVIARAVFHQPLQEFESHKKQFQIMGNAMKSMMNMMLLHVHGSDDSVSIGWQSFHVGRD